MSAYDEQALAAMRRCLEVADGGGPWHWAADGVRVALAACIDYWPPACGDLDTNPAWQLTEEGELPTS